MLKKLHWILAERRVDFKATFEHLLRFIWCCFFNISEEKCNMSSLLPDLIWFYSFLIYCSVLFKWELPAGLFPSPKRRATERGWLENRPFSFQSKALLWIGRHCNLPVIEIKYASNQPHFVNQRCSRKNCVTLCYWEFVLNMLIDEIVGRFFPKAPITSNKMENRKGH